MSLLRVRTVARDKKRSDVVVFADAVMYRLDSRSQEATILGLSMIGQEQALRAIAAGCADKVRTPLEITGPSGRVVVGCWGWKWKCEALELLPGAVHMVAIAEDNPKEHERLIVPPENSDESLKAAMYDVLLSRYDTPLIPAGRPGQSPEEAKLGEIWRDRVTTVVAAKYWRPLLPHPEQPDHSWQNAGVLTLQQATLDQIVSRMVKARQLPIVALS